MNALRKIHWQEQPVLHACPLHPKHAMQPVRVQGRELWQCDHPGHITNISAIRAGVITARARSESLPDDWRIVPPPLYVLPEPPPRQATGAIQPVTPATTPVSDVTGRPAWLEAIVAYAQGPEQLADNWLNSPMPVEHSSLRLAPEECELDQIADANNGIDSDDTTQAPALLFLRHSRLKG